MRGSDSTLVGNKTMHQSVGAVHCAVDPLWTTVIFQDSKRSVPLRIPVSASEPYHWEAGVDIQRVRPAVHPFHESERSFSNTFKGTQGET